MTDPDRPTTTLQPANSSPLEAALELGFARFLDRIAPPFPELLDPLRTPVDFLPYLAADRGVQAWDSEAPEVLQRATIAAAWSMKRQAGTRKALAQALATTGFAPAFQSWKETGGQPYSLVIVATSETRQTQEDYRNLERRVSDAKSERDVVTIRVEKAIPLAQRLRLAQLTQLATAAQILSYSSPNTPPSELAIAGLLHTATHVKIGAL